MEGSPFLAEQCLLQKLEEAPYSVNMSKKKPRWKKGLSLGLLAVLGCAAVVFVSQWMQLRRSSQVLLALGEVNQLEIGYQRHSLRLKKQQGEWIAQSWDDAELVDQRANGALVEHLVEILGGLRRINKKSLNLDSAAEKGVAQPWLSISVGWENPKEGSDVILFGDKLSHMRSIYAFLPKRVELVETSFGVVKLLENKKIEDFRDQRVTKLVSDDVDDVTTSKVCSSFHLYRDGDHWVWKSKVPKSVAQFQKPNRSLSEASDAWLDELLATHYVKVDEDLKKKETLLSKNSLCEIQLEGRNGIRERLVMDPSSKWVANVVLPASYQVPSRFDELLK